MLRSGQNRCLHLPRQVAGQCQHRRVSRAAFISAGDKMIAARSRRKRRDDLSGLTGGGQRDAFLVADANPFDVAVPDGIGKRVEGIASQAENTLDADLLEHTDRSSETVFDICCS